MISSMLPLHESYFLLITFIIIFFILYKNSLRKLQYWRNKNVPHPKPFPFIGNLLDVIALNFTDGFHLAKLYNQFQTPYFGMYIFHYPYLIIKDPELIKLILIKDFQYFTDRLLSAEEEFDSLTANFTFFLKNPRWKCIRSKLAPLFTITKVKRMLSLMNDVADDMIKHVRERLNTGPLDVKNVFTKYALDTTAVCALGVKAHCFKAENGSFMVFAKNLFKFSWRNFIVQSCHLLAFRMVKFFKLRIFDDNVCNFIRELGWEALRKRMNSTTRRHDVTDVIKQMLEENLRKHVKFGTDRAIAQVGTILIAAFETVSSTMTFALCEMCLQPGIQNKVREEINTVLSRFGNIYNEALEDMKYLHMRPCENTLSYCFWIEHVQKITEFPIVMFIEKGTPVIIPLLELHYNPSYFSDPNKFDPERFADDSKYGLYNRTCYLPFGKGPRIFLGEKFALQEVILGLIRILSEYKVDKSEDTPSSIELTTKGFITGPKQKIKLLFTKIA